MALQNTRRILFPQMPPLVLAAPAFSTTLLLDAASEKMGVVFCPSRTGNIRKVHFRTGNVVTGGGGPASKPVRIETVDSGGLPSGTLWAANTETAIAIADTDDNVWKTTAALTADAVITDVDVPVAVVIANPASDFGNWIVSAIGGSLAASGRPYCLLYTTSWAKQTALSPVMAIEYSDGVIDPIPGMWPIVDFQTQVVRSDTTPDEVGIRFMVPFRGRVDGFWYFHNSSGATGDFEMVFYDSDGTESLLTQVTAGQLRANTYQTINEKFSGTHVIEPNTWYRLSFRALTVNQSTVTYMGCSTTALMNALLCGPDCYWTERSDGGTWTDTNTRWPMMGAHIDQLSDDVQAGGSNIFIQRQVIA